MGSVITDLCSLIELQSSIIAMQAEALEQVKASVDGLEKDLNAAREQYTRLVGRSSAEEPKTEAKEEETTINAGCF